MIIPEEEGIFVDHDQLLNLATDLGYGLLESGAEIYQIGRAHV